MTELIPTIILNDGVEIPALGFGTYKLKGATGVNSILSAINNGYRLLDSAFNYENEGTLGEALRRTNVAREELFITSKLPGKHQKYDEAIATIQESLYRTGVDYYDLYLIHWPNPKQGHYVEAWRALIDAQKWGLIRSIGVCNFLPEHVATLIKETGVVPSINQIELHPFFNQEEQRNYNQSKEIVTQSWSPLGRKLTALLENDALKRIAQKYHKSIPQIILRWHVELGAIPIPKSSSSSRQVENRQIFDFSLTQEERDVINQLTKEDGRLANQDPAEYEEF